MKYSDLFLMSSPEVKLIKTCFQLDNLNLEVGLHKSKTWICQEAKNADILMPLEVVKDLLGKRFFKYEDSGGVSLTEDGLAAFECYHYGQYRPSELLKNYYAQGYKEGTYENMVHFLADLSIPKIQDLLADNRFESQFHSYVTE